MTTTAEETELKPIGRSMQLSLASLRIVDKRDPGTAEEIRGLAKSIDEVGLLYPLIVRKSEDGDGYDIVAGGRRKRALHHLKIEVAPCILVAGKVGEKAGLMRAAENFQRLNLHPLEEAATVRSLLDDEGWDLPTVARSLGRSKAWVARRASLTDLSESWLKEINDRQNEQNFIPHWPPSHLEVISRFPAEVQDRLLQNYIYAWRRSIPRLEDVIDATAEYQLLLSGAPWEFGDETIVPEVGACAACSKRSAHHPELFPEELPAGNGKTETGDRCLDTDCWAMKALAFIQRRTEQLRQEHPNLVLLDTSEKTNVGELSRTLGGEIWKPYEVVTCKKTADGATPALVVDGPGLGKVRYIKKPEQLESSNGNGAHQANGNGKTEAVGEVQVKSIAERREPYDKRRRQVVIEEIQAKLRTLFEEANREQAIALEGGAALLERGLAAKTIRLLFDLLGTQGWDRNVGSDSPWPTDEAWQSLTKLRNHDLGRDEQQAQILDLCWHLLRLVLQTCVSRLSVPVGARDNAAFYAEAETLCRFLGFDLAALRAAAAEKIPYAKAWRDEVVDGWEPPMITTTTAK